MSKPDSTKRPAVLTQAQQMRRDAVADIIRRAEQSISGQKYGSAQDLLAEAWRLDPGNAYIPAIVERAKLMESMHHGSSEQNGSNGGPVLAATVGPQFPSGIATGPRTLNADEQSRLRRLLMVVTTLFERGAYEAAYETIQKAEQVAPDDQGVKTLKEQIRPHYEAFLTRRRGRETGSFRREDNPGVAAAMAEKLLAATPPAASTTEQGPKLEALRVEELRKQKDLERRLRERELWRQAGAAIPPLDTPQLPRPVPPAAPPPPKSGLLSTIFKGKIF
jgi:hypothetical protein